MICFHFTSSLCWVSDSRYCHLPTQPWHAQWAEHGHSTVIDCHQPGCWYCHHGAPLTTSAAQELERILVHIIPGKSQLLPVSFLCSAIWSLDPADSVKWHTNSDRVRPNLVPASQQPACPAYCCPGLVWFSARPPPARAGRPSPSGRFPHICSHFCSLWFTILCTQVLFDNVQFRNVYLLIVSVKLGYLRVVVGVEFNFKFTESVTCVRPCLGSTAQPSPDNNLKWAPSKSG